MQDWLDKFGFVWFPRHHEYNVPEFRSDGFVQILIDPGFFLSRIPVESRRLTPFTSTSFWLESLDLIWNRFDSLKVERTHCQCSFFGRFDWMLMPPIPTGRSNLIKLNSFCYPRRIHTRPACLYFCYCLISISFFFFFLSFSIFSALNIMQRKLNPIIGRKYFNSISYFDFLCCCSCRVVCRCCTRSN